MFTFDIPGVDEVYEPWIEVLAILAGAVIVALIAHSILYRVLDRLVRRTKTVADTSAVHHTRGAARLLLVVVAIWIAWRIAAVALLGPKEVAGEDGELREIEGMLSASTLGGMEHALNVALIAAVTWLLIRALSIIDDVVVARHEVEVEDNLQARRLLTQMRVLSRTAMIITGIIGFAIILMTFPGVREFGASLLASAGLAGIVVGFAARPTLSNLIAGIQLALTQPMRLDDVVIVEGEWGRIEEITSTYVVVRIWDQRRLIVPLEHFINTPFQNWTRSTADILGTVYLYADYTVAVDEVRAELERIVKTSDKWDGKVVGLVVTDAKERVVELRALVSASNSGNAWDLRCYVREKLIEYLQREQPGSLPRTRAEINPGETLGVYLERNDGEERGLDR